MKPEEVRTKIKAELEKHQRVLIEKIKSFLATEKPSDVLIIKAHLICEYYLNQILILKKLCTAKQISEKGFFEKCNLALDITKADENECRDSLLGLNKLRNKVGHELEYLLSETDVDSLGFLKGEVYILKKYDFDSLQELLRNTLIGIVIDLSLIVFSLVYDIKKHKEVTKQ